MVLVLHNLTEYIYWIRKIFKSDARERLVSIIKLPEALVIGKIVGPGTAQFQGISPFFEASSPAIAFPQS
jgi:hypothetical protein